MNVRRFKPDWIWYALVAFFLAHAFIGCGRAEKELTTGVVVSRADLPMRNFAGDTAYAIVRSDALPGIYDNFRDVLSKQGLVKWDERYDCNHFAALYVSLAQARYAVAAFHSTSTAQTLALAEVWYVTGGKAHAIVAADTERGIVYIEPQTGGELQLTPAERESVFLCKW